MPKKRASIFEDASDLDVSGFLPKMRADVTGPSPAQVRAVAEAANFHSREPTPAEVPGRGAHIYRTGRNLQLNLKVTRETAEKFYAIARAQGWVLGQTLERAVEALRRELESAP